VRQGDREKSTLSGEKRRSSDFPSTAKRKGKQGGGDTSDKVPGEKAKVKSNQEGFWKRWAVGGYLNMERKNRNEASRIPSLWRGGGG